jgi:hypothetical protein
LGIFVDLLQRREFYARIFAEGISGVAARRIESSLTQLGFPDKIPASQKKEFLFPNISFKEGKTLLDERFEAAKEFISSHSPEYTKYILEEEKVWDLREFYAKNFEEVEKNPKPFHMVSLNNEESLGGTLKMIKGPFLGIETNEEFVFLLAKELVGKTVSFAECEEGLTTNDAFQSAMF